METFKKIMFYAILIFAFIIFSNFMIKVGLENTYKTISGEIKTSSPEITISEIKTTDVNGYAKGTIKNNFDNNIEKIYIKLDLYSKENVNLGTKYFEVNNLRAGASREFEINYRYSKVERYEITCVYEK